MKMEFSQAYMLAVADQLALVSTFLGGVCDDFDHHRHR